MPFDLLELDGHGTCGASQSRRARRRWPASCRQRRDGLRLSKRLELTVFQHACADGRAAPAAERRDGQPPIRTQGETVVFENRILNEIEAPVLLYGQ